MTIGSRVPARRIAVSLTAAALAVTAFAPPAAAEPTWLPIKDLSSGPAEDRAATAAVGANGTTVVAWTRWEGDVNKVVAARRTAAGSWGSAVAISGNETVTQLPHVAVDGANNALVLWGPREPFGPIRVAQRSASATAWSAPVTLAAEGWGGDLAVDEDGNALAVWGARDPIGSGRIYAARKAAGGSWGTPQKVSGLGLADGQPDVEFDGNGNATVVWESWDGNDYDVQSSRRPAGGSWTAPVTIAGSDDYESAPVLTVDHSGNAVAAWEHVASGTARVEAAYRQGRGAWSSPGYASPTGESGVVADIDIDDSGNVVAVWNVTTGGTSTAKAASLLPDGTWSAPATVSELGNDARATSVSLDKAGNAAVSLNKQAGDERATQVVSKPAGGGWGAPTPLSDLATKASGAFITHDTQGNAIAVWSKGTGTTDTEIQTRTLDAAGPSSTITKPVASRQTATSFTAEWTAVDRWSGIGTKDVRYRVAPWNAGFGEQTTWKTGTADNSATLAGAAGNSYCFSARARDEHDNEGAWSSQRCTATPLDDYSLSRSGTWTRASSSSYYLGTYTSTKSSGAALIRTGVKAKHIALLATKCANCGQVKVFLNGTSLGTFNLYRSTLARKQLISVKTFTTVQTGTLKIQVVSPTGKTVYLDGVVLRAF